MKCREMLKMLDNLCIFENNKIGWGSIEEVEWINQKDSLYWFLQHEQNGSDLSLISISKHGSWVLS